MSLKLINRVNILKYYSPYNFCREIHDEKHVDLVKKSFLKLNRYSIIISGSELNFYYSFLEWDTSFFSINTVKLYNVMWESIEREVLTKAISVFDKYLKEKYKAEYIFIEIPSEDIELLQALGNNSFKLIETRLTYFNNEVKNYSQNKRFKTRKSNIDDIENLKRVALEMRNNYDRFHADKTFNLDLADLFLSRYIEESINGFCDIVLVPNEPGIESDSFLTANYLEQDWKVINRKVSKMVLSAVSSKTNKGWYVKLISEMTYHLKELGVDTIFMNTQSTNRAVFRVWEKLGYKMGATSHIFSKNI